MKNTLIPRRRFGAKSILLGATFVGSVSMLGCQPSDQENSSPSGDSGDVRVVEGEFGALRGVKELDLVAIRASAQEVMHQVIATELGGSGNEVMVPGKVTSDRSGGVHVRFTQEIDGIVLEGASMVLHARADGTVVAANGDFVSVDNLPSTPRLDSNAALNSAMGATQIQNEAVKEVDLGYVLGSDGQAHMAWRATVDYKDGDDPQRDVIFADTETGKLVARHPQYHYARALETIDANNSSSDRKWVTASTSSNTINTGDAAIDSAHNYAIATYNYYLANHGRDSIDGAGMTLVSRAHWGRNYNNAYWDGSQMTYGDGDGVTFVPLSQDADVVAHELTHGVTERSSGMIYQGESGALNEAWSDIFGSMVDRQEGAAGADIWLLGEDIYTPGTAGDGLRDMADPAAMGDYDYYPTRYTGTSDNGGVHSNSGIANLAFVLLVDGGSHPRGKTSVVVPALGASAAANIFYAANVNCLTANATFAEARFCTAAAATSDADAAAVHLAWDAVGVPTEYTAPPEPLAPIELTDGSTLAGQTSNDSTYQTYYLATVADGDAVQCTTSANNGDADLYLRFNADPEPTTTSSVNACASYSSTSNESCTTGAANGTSTLNALVHAYTAYSNLSITCTSIPATGGTCQLAPLGQSCNVDGDCCSNNCKGKPGSKVCK